MSFEILAALGRKMGHENPITDALRCEPMAETLSDLRHARLSQKELAARAGLDRWTLGKIETGRIVPTGEEVERIASALGVERNVIVKILKTTLEKRGDEWIR